MRRFGPPGVAPRIVERVDVTRVLINARVVDAGGQPVLELGTDDFDVEIGGEPAPVESVVWVSGRTGRSEAELTASPVVRSDFLRQGRLVVLLFQKDMERGRIRGLMRMLVELRGFLDIFRPDDRVAVLSFDTYLELGLQTVSDETGGFFARTNVFTAQPLRRLEGALAGHYVLFVEKPPLDPGEHRIHVTLTWAKGRVLARLTFVG